MERLAFDKASARSIDTNGYLHVAMNNISKATVNPYRGAEIPRYQELGLDPAKVYNLFRDPDALEKAAPTFNNLPIVSEHIAMTSGNFDDEAIRALQIGTTGTDAYFEAPFLRNSCTIWSQNAIDDIESERTEQWSCAYRYVPVMDAGEYEGLRYDGRMDNIRGNHVALVIAGRAGDDAVVADKMPEGLSMTIKSRLALKTSGAISALIQPKLKEGSKLAFDSAFAGVTAANLGKRKDKIAADIVKLATPKLAQDEGIDADDVVAVIEAVMGNSADVPAAEDNIPDATSEEDKTVGDADGDTVAKIMSFLEGKLSDDDMAACAKLVGGEGAEDEDTDDDDDKDKDKVDKPAMDAAIKSATAKVRADTIREMNDIKNAENLVRPLIGDVPAMDSAAAVYKLALDANEVDHEGIGDVTALKALVKMIKPAKEPLLAQDTAHRTEFQAAKASFNKMLNAE